MSTRLAQGGRQLDRSKQIEFSFNGKRLTGFEGDTLASALLANDQMLVGRSFKYHRPRGIVASGAEEPNALVNLGRDGRFEPNQRATTTELFDGLRATSQNHWPSLEYDIGALNQLVSQVLPAGFYYKTFMAPRPAWKHLFEPIIRQSAGLGKAPKAADADRYEHFHASVDVLVIGGGVAGLTAAARAGASAGTGASSGTARVLLIEQGTHWGGRTPVDHPVADGSDDQIDALVDTVAEMPNVEMRLRCMGAGTYDHGYVLAYERLGDHQPHKGKPRHRLWKIRAKQVIVATGAIERPLSFAGNDVPGVMLASAVRDFIGNFGVSPGDRTAVVTNNDDAYRTALAVVEAGLEVPVIIDARPEGGGALADQARARGIRVENGAAVSRIRGRRRVEGVLMCRQAGEGGAGELIPCDAVAMSGGWSPAVHLWSHCGGKLKWAEDQAFFYPDPDRPPTGADGRGFVRCAGAANGNLGVLDAASDGNTAGTGALADAGFAARAITLPVPVDLTKEAPMAAVWVMPQGAGYELRSKMWLDFQNDVKVSDVQLAAREGFESVEHTKRYTTLGMATDQGKLSNINGLAVLSDALNQEIPRTGTTTFRPPYTPISMGAIAGEARGDTFQPLRRTAMHDWHAANGADWEPVGHWRRPYCFTRGDETVEQAVAREVTATRSSLGLLDASTLGKIIVKGPDAGRFLDMLYTNKMASLKPGRCRYGLMCTENGFLMDDGVVVRLDEDTFLCHTTTGGAERIHGWMEDWLQCEWWDWQVYTANVTEAYGQIGVVGPNARKVLEKLGGLDVSKEALPFMGYVEGTLGGFPVRVFRISFSGELSYEVAVPTGQARALWDALLAAGEAFDVTPYGTEALHIMRAEKGFIMIGDETDGTVIPQDLGLDWAISKKKEDYLGKRAQQRLYMQDPNRWKLVGLETLEGNVLPDGAYAVLEGENANGQQMTEGRVTSTYHSPTLNRGIAMGLVLHGPDRMGEILDFPDVHGHIIQAKIVDPVFYDPKGEKQDV